MKGSRAQQQLDELFRFDKVQELRCDEVGERLTSLTAP